MKTILLFILVLFFCSCADTNAPRSITYTKGDLWVADFRDGSFPGKELHNNKIYCSSLEISSGKPNYFYCLDLLSGKVNWRTPVANLVGSNPIIKDTLIYYSSYLGDIYRIDTTGNPVWKTKLPSGSYARHAFNPINGNLFVLTVSNGCYEFSKENGQVVQHWGTGSLGMDMPIIKDSTIILAEINSDTSYLTAGNLMVSLDYYSKDTLWRKETDKYTEQPYLNKGRLYYMTQQRLHCIDVITGQNIWSSQPLMGFPSSWTHLYFEQDKVLIVGDNSQKIILNASNGQWIESVKIEDLEKRSPYMPFKYYYRIEGEDKTMYMITVSRSYFLLGYEYDYRIAIDKKHNR